MKLETFPCPVCAAFEMEEGDYVICPTCGWENDPNQLRFPGMGGANQLSLIEMRLYWELTNKKHPPNRTAEAKEATRIVHRELNRRKYAEKYGHDKYS